MRRSWCFAVAPVAAVLVAGCGSDDAGSPSTTASSPSTSVAASSPATSSPPVSSSAETSAAPSSTAAGSDNSSVGPAPAGSAIKVGAANSLPTKVGGWTLNKGGSGPASIYSNGSGLIGVSFLPASDYAAIVKNVTRQKTRAGTGYCGSTSIVTNLTCYLKTGDGVINISADSGDSPLPQVVAFANELTAILGTR